MAALCHSPPSTSRGCSCAAPLAMVTCARHTHVSPSQPPFLRSASSVTSALYQSLQRCVCISPLLSSAGSPSPSPQGQRSVRAGQGGRRGRGASAGGTAGGGAWTTEWAGGGGKGSG